VTQDPETKDYMIVMQYANNGSLLSYLDQNINKLTWRMKLQYLRGIADALYAIHSMGLVHCDLHGRSIVLHIDNESETEKDFQLCDPFIHDFSLSRPENSHQSTIQYQGILPFIAPEVFHTWQFTKKSDIYSFGLICI